MVDSEDESGEQSPTCVEKQTGCDVDRYCFYISLLLQRHQKLSLVFTILTLSFF